MGRLFLSLVTVLPLLGVAAAAQRPADAPAGERIFRRCIACHAIEPGSNSPAGPTLHAIVGRAIAGEAGFNYSPAMRAFAQRHPRWTRELLDDFLAEPESLVPGTEMSFWGLDDPGERHRLIAWLEARARPGR